MNPPTPKTSMLAFVTLTSVVPVMTASTGPLIVAVTGPEMASEPGE